MGGILKDYLNRNIYNTTLIIILSSWQNNSRQGRVGHTASLLTNAWRSLPVFHQMHRCVCTPVTQMTVRCRWITSLVQPKPILRSDQEKELVHVTSREEQRKLVVNKNFSQTFVKNSLYFLCSNVIIENYVRISR